MMYAVYNGNTYLCSMMQGGKKINLRSKTYIEGFTKGISNYILQVDREKCERVFRRELCFRYKNDSFLVTKEENDKVLLETGPRSYDLSTLGFDKVLHDVFQKWVSKSEGELYWSETDY